MLSGRYNNLIIDRYCIYKCKEYFLRILLKYTLTIFDRLKILIHHPCYTLLWVGHLILLATALEKLPWLSHVGNLEPLVLFCLFFLLLLQPSNNNLEKWAGFEDSVILNATTMNNEKNGNICLHKVCGDDILSSLYQLRK